MARPGAAHRSHSRRSDELFAAFNGPSETDPALPGYGEASSSVARARSSNDVFFDAGDALPDPDPHTNDPLGADRANNASASATSTTPTPYRPPPLFSRSGNTPAYDFERPEYFPVATRRPPSSSNATSPRADPNTTSADSSNLIEQHHTVDMSFESEAHGNTDTNTGGVSITRNGYNSVPTSSGGYGSRGGGGATGQDASGHMSRADRMRFALGRFGRFVGMGIPGARYSSLSTQDGGSAGVHRPRVVGGGIGQDGVFANLSAKPERRRRGQGGDDDRGDDDDLEDNVQPPTYEVAAADAVPQYWETTILGGSVHPLANGLGWTPGGAHVGAIEDLIVEGLAVGNLFGFAWNLLVSMTFQFVGFLLTYLLHTTHAARCGSRAGLGVTLVQYGFYLRQRASEMAEGKLVDTGFSGGGGAIVIAPGADHRGDGWFEDADADASTSRRRRRAQGAPVSEGQTLADLFAAQADGQPVNIGDQNLTDSMSQSTEWLAYVLMVVGWTLLLSSMLSYWRIYRWGKGLVDAARRDEASNNANDAAAAAAASGAAETAESGNGATNFVHRFRSIFGSARGSSSGTGEDWIMFPGAGRRVGSRRGQSLDHPTSIADLEDEDGLDTEDARLNSSERRLLNDMRRLGLA